MTEGQVPQIQQLNDCNVQSLLEAFMDLDAAMTSLLEVASSPLILDEFTDHGPDREEFATVDGVTQI